MHEKPFTQRLDGPDLSFILELVIKPLKMTSDRHTIPIRGRSHTYDKKAQSKSTNKSVSSLVHKRAPIYSVALQMNV